MLKLNVSPAVGTGRLHLLSIFVASLAVLSTGGSTALLVKFLPRATAVPPSPPSASAGPTCPCDSVTISLSGDASSVQSARAGGYVRTWTVSNGRWVYEQHATGNYLFYTGQAWMVGFNYTDYGGGLQALSSASCPSSASDWKYYDNGWQSGGTSVTDCAPPTPPPSPPAPPTPPAPPPWPPGRAPLPPPPALPPADCDAAEEKWDNLGDATGVPALIFGFLAISLPTASQPKLFLALYLPALALGILGILVCSPLGYSWLVPEQCDYDPATLILFIICCMILSLFLIFPPLEHLRLRKKLRARIAAIEGDLPERLADGSLRLLRVAWLLERPTDWVIPRQQDLPEEAFWAPADAARLLAERKVAALSYKWQGPFNSSKGGGDQPDGSRFHLEQVLSYYREGRHAEERPALMWDFAAVPQHDPITGEKRTAAETSVFKKGLGVMSNAYASPRVLVLQHRRIPLHLERELNEIYDGAPPDDRLDLIPYAGAKCRSGWCTSETACALLMTEGGGHAYELGVGRVPVTRGRLPSVQQMEALFEAESTRFIGRADREEVCSMYLALRKKLEEYDKEQKGMFVFVADKLMTEENPRYRILSLAIPVNGLFFILSSRILRAHLAAVLCRRPRDSLDYTFHWSIRKPPFRRKPDPPLSELPSCFLPTEQGEQAPSGLKSMSSMFAKVRLVSQERALL